MPLPTDPELVAGCLTGDSASWSLLTDRYLRLVVSVARRAGLDADQASDAAQDTFLALWRNLGRVREIQSLAGWLATTAKRRAWRINKRAFNRRRREERGARPETSPEALPERMVLEEERRHLVRRAFAGLGERCRRLLDLLFFRPEAPYTEIATEAGIAVGSIGPTRQRCLQKLERELAAYGFSREDVSGVDDADSRPRNAPREDRKPS